MEQTAAPCQLGVMKENAAETAARMEGWRNEEVKREQRGLNYLKKKKKRTCSLLTPYASAQTLSGKGREKEIRTRQIRQFIHSFIQLSLTTAATEATPEHPIMNMPH